MQKWELCTICVSVQNETKKEVWLQDNRPNYIWTQKESGSDKTGWERVAAQAKAGWELVSVTPITFNGYTSWVLYTFKKAIEEDM